MATTITKKDILTAIKAIAENDEINVTVDDKPVTSKDIINYVDTTITQMDNKAAKAAERAATKRAEGDALRDLVQGVLTDEFQTIAQIVSQIDYEDITQAKVSARLTKLIDNGLAHKTKVKTEDGRTVNGYAAGADPAE